MFRWVHRIRSDEALNCVSPEVTTPAAPGAVSGPNPAARLHNTMSQLVAYAFDPDASQVDYAGLGAVVELDEITAAAVALRTFDLLSLTERGQRMAFWINLYNALMIHAAIAYGVRRSVREIDGFFERAAYVVNGYRFSADDIEHGILRANAGHPAVPGPRFLARDPRRRFCRDPLDPRIHFALNPSVKALLPIELYRADALDTQLTHAGYYFIGANGLILDRDTMTIYLSSIFRRYARDFGGSWRNQVGIGGYGSLLCCVARYLPDERDREFITAHTDDLRVQFLEYDWHLDVARDRG